MDQLQIFHPSVQRQRWLQTMALWMATAVGVAWLFEACAQHRYGFVMPALVLALSSVAWGPELNPYGHVLFRPHELVNYVTVQSLAAATSAAYALTYREDSWATAAAGGATTGLLIRMFVLYVDRRAYVRSVQQRAMQQIEDERRRRGEE
jgi:hypothetical protein